MENNSKTSKVGRRKIVVQIIVDVIIWLSVSLVVIYLFLFGKPYETGFFCDDPSLSLPSISETISTHLLVAVGFTVSVLLVLFVELFNYLDAKCRHSLHRTDDISFCVKSYIVFMIGFLIQELFVDAVKNQMGRLRPNFFDVCNPQFNRTMCPGYVSEYICTGKDEEELKSSRQSFPSGHSTFAMYIAIYFGLYTEYRLQVRFSRLLKVFIQTGLVLTAFLCGFGRIRDNKHHLIDVLAGFILGIIVATFVFFMLGRKFVKYQSVTKKLFFQQTSRDSCYKQQSRGLDLETPLPLLQDECSNNIEFGRIPSSTKLIILQNNNHHDEVMTSENV